MRKPDGLGVVYAKVGVMFALTISFAAAGATVPAIIFAGLTALTAFVFYLWRDELNLVASLRRRPRKVCAITPTSSPPSWGCSSPRSRLVPLVGFMMFRALAGAVAVSRDAVATGREREFASTATEAAERRVLRVGDSGTPSRTTVLAAVSGIWFISAALETRAFVIGGAICPVVRDAPVGTSDFSGGVCERDGHALGPSLDLCASGRSS